MSVTSLTTSRSAGLLGSQTPRVWCAPSAPTSAGPEAIRLAELARLQLLPWQGWFVDVALRQTAQGRWAAKVVVLVVPRQNGKGTCLEVMELHHLFVMGLKIYHTSVLMETCRKAYARLWELIERTPSLLRRVVGKPQITADKIHIRLVNGGFITYMARGAKAGRGFDDADVVVLDEGLFLNERMVDALIPAMATRRHGQVWITSSAAVPESKTLRRMVARGYKGDTTLVFAEWSVPRPTRANPLRPTDPDVIAQANPSFGDGPDSLITMAGVLDEHLTMTEQGYARERLGIHDEDPAADATVIPEESWTGRGGLGSVRPGGSVGFGVAASWPDADVASIVVAGGLDGDEVSVQVIASKPGTSWVIPMLVQLDEAWENVGVGIDPGGPAGKLIDDAVNEGLWVHTPTARDVAHWSADFRAGLGVEEGDDAVIRHYDQAEFVDAVATAGRRNLGDGWTFQRRTGGPDISPLEAAMLALGVWRANGGGVEAFAVSM